MDATRLHAGRGRVGAGLCASQASYASDGGRTTPFGQTSTYYRAQVRIDAERAKTHPNPKLASVALKPGMTATVDIRTGNRSVLKYLAKPVYKAFSGAFNER